MKEADCDYENSKLGKDNASKLSKDCGCDRVWHSSHQLPPQGDLDRSTVLTAVGAIQPCALAHGAIEASVGNMMP